MGHGIRQYTGKIRRQQWFRPAAGNPIVIREILVTEQYWPRTPEFEGGMLASCRDAR